MTNLTVKLEQMTVKQKTALGVVDQKIPQMRIWASLAGNPDIHVGYVGTQQGASVNIIRRDIPEDLAELIQTEVKKQLGTAGDALATAPTAEELAELDQNKSLYGPNGVDPLDEDDEEE
jgi:hypothetical protein